MDIIASGRMVTLATAARAAMRARIATVMDTTIIQAMAGTVRLTEVTATVALGMAVAVYR